MDHDLFEFSIPQLERYYTERKYTVAQVVKWHLARIHGCNGIYRATEQVLKTHALETAVWEDSETARGGTRGPLWGPRAHYAAPGAAASLPSRCFASSAMVG